jgi:hypothetical protein
LKNSIKIIIVLLSLAILLGAVSCKKEKIIPPTADFSIIIQASGQLVYSYGVLIGANYLVKVTLKELSGVGAQILTVKTTFVDVYGNTDVFNSSGGEVFSGGYIAGRSQNIGVVKSYIGVLVLAKVKTVQMTIEFLDDNAHHITKTVQASVQW